MMEMSRGTEGDKSKEEKGVVKTEVPQVQWAKRTCENYYTYSIYYLFSLLTFKSSFCYEPGLTKIHFTLSPLLR